MNDCIVIGAGAAGLSAGLTLARARRQTLLIDAGQQSNLVATGIGGLLGHDRRPPSEYYAAAHDELAAYPTVEVIVGEAVQAARNPDGTFEVTLAGGRREQAQTVVLAPGMDYRYPGVPGLAERWGTSAFHCPFCGGWEARGRPMAVLATGNAGVHGAANLRAWTDRITLLTNGSELSADQREMLSARGIAYDPRPVAALEGPGTDLERVSFHEGADLAVTALLVKSTLYQRSTLARDLGATVTAPDDWLAVEAITVDAVGRTEIPGLYAAGDAATSIPPSMPAAVTSGYMAAAMAVGQIMK